MSPVDPVGSVVPVTVLGGYLGAGKTTIVNGLLARATERLAVLVNDFGDIVIDAELIEAADDEMITLANGCICCSLVDGFASALDQIRELAVAPDRLVIETSGVADTAAVAAYAQTPGFRLDGVLIAADAETIQARSADAYVGQTVRAQLTAGDLIIVTKTDLVGPEPSAAAEAWLRGHYPDTPIMRSISGAIPNDVAFGSAAASGARPAANQPLPDGDELFVSASWAGGAVASETLDAVLWDRPSGLVRAKGIVALNPDGDGPVVVNVVGARVDRAPGLSGWGPESQLVAIGLRSEIDEAALQAWLSQLASG